MTNGYLMQQPLRTIVGRVPALRPERVSVSIFTLSSRPSQPIHAGAAVAAFEHAFVGMAVLGTDGTWLHVNDALCRILGSR